jgi:hypothetical protein
VFGVPWSGDKPTYTTTGQDLQPPAAADYYARRAPNHVRKLPHHTFMTTIHEQAFSPPTLVRLDLQTSQEKSRVWLSLLLLLIFSPNPTYHYLLFSPRSRSKSGRSASSITTITEGSKEFLEGPLPQFGSFLPQLRPTRVQWRWLEGACMHKWRQHDTNALAASFGTTATSRCT